AGFSKFRNRGYCWPMNLKASFREDNSPCRLHIRRSWRKQWKRTRKAETGAGKSEALRRRCRIQAQRAGPRPEPERKSEPAKGRPRWRLRPARVQTLLAIAHAHSTLAVAHAHSTVMLIVCLKINPLVSLA